MNPRTSPTSEAALRPRRLRPGDAVAIVAPASPLKPKQRQVVEGALQVLMGWGLRPRMAPDLWGSRGYLAGTDQVRAAQLLWAFQEEEIRGVFCLRGGYGSMRILPFLKPKLLREDPKIFVGFSDLTALLVHLLQKGSMVAFHGPTLNSPDLADGPSSPTARSLFRITMEGLPPEPIAGEAWQGGRAEGPLVGGCLSVLAALMGTPFAPRFAGAVLFLEDVNEPPYRVDRMLSQLRMAGALRGVQGIALGDMASRGGSRRQAELREALRGELCPLNIPILYGVPSGHGRVNLTLPLGTRVRLDGDQGVLSFHEAGVAPR